MADGYQYPDQWSIISVYKKDGEVAEYRLKVSPGISPYLCEQAGRTGFLTLLAGSKAINIPVSEIERFEIELDEDQND